MRTRLILWAILGTTPLVAASSDDLTVVGQGEGWRALFDGMTLSHWRGQRTESPGPGWRVHEGVLTLAGKAGDLVSVDAFGDFELELEWKISAGGNSGIIYRASLDEPQAYRTGPEYQLLDNARAKDNKQADHLAGSLYDLAAPRVDATRPVGEWNRTRIVVRGWNVEHWLNGQKIVELDLHAPAGRAAIARSKFKDWPKFASQLRGHVVLQDHGDGVSFRAIRIRELK